MTQNLADFPEASLTPFGIEAQHPDDFLSNQLNLAPGLFCGAVRPVRARLRNPAFSVEAYQDTLSRQGLMATAAEMEQSTALL
ncbi:hypothetical protein [Thermaurantiacus sp.]|uniref:hypothetical protein n=1 Tax=Thermaurantiacus sp. TaxID=2820283 RepID=UPI00298F2BB7|nr:hypothetical protein [Thermaurantiacus sp.]